MVVPYLIPGPREGLRASVNICWHRRRTKHVYNIHARTHAPEPASAGKKVAFFLERFSGSKDFASTRDDNPKACLPVAVLFRRARAVHASNTPAFVYAQRPTDRGAQWATTGARGMKTSAKTPAEILAVDNPPGRRMRARPERRAQGKLRGNAGKTYEKSNHAAGASPRRGEGRRGQSPPP